MSCHSVVKYFAAVLILFGVVKGQEIQGRVNVGSDPSSVTSGSYFATLNVNSGILPLYFDLYNVTDGTVVTGEAFDEDVIVSCDTVTNFTDGDSVISFSDETVQLRNDITTATVSFDIDSQGRRIEVQCRGETDASSTSTTSYFNLDSSAGQTGFVTVKKSPTVSLCEEQISVPNADGIKSGQVSLRLSESVQDFNVTARCEVTGVSQDNPTVWLRFTEVRIEIGEDSAVMGYSITGSGDTLQVECYAESDDGDQFLRNTSRSEETLFAFETGSAQILPATSTVTSGSFNLLLSLSDPLRSGEEDVTFFCSLSAFNTTDEAQELIDQRECVAPDATTAAPPATVGSTATITPGQNDTDPNSTQPNPTPLATTQLPMTTPPITTQPPTTQSRTFPPPTDAPLVNDTATWSLVVSQIVFQEGDMVQTLQVRLRNSGLGYRGVLLVRCCATAELNTNPKYSASSASGLALVNVAAAKAINWTAASVSTDQAETAITNPAYTEVSPCPCDLTANSCDVNCCCDQLCSEEEIASFTCIPGIPGGDFTKQYDYMCNSPDIFRPDWSPFLCVETNNSPYLGLHFVTRTGARDPAAYNDLRATATAINQGLTSFEDSSQRSLDFENPDANSGGYKFGFPVETLFDSNARGFLALPQADPNGGCSWLSPIRFQMDSSSSCNVNSQQGLCSESSVLSARAFVLSTNAAYPPCPEAPGIISSYSGSTPTPTSVRYYCRDDITPYVVSSTELGELFPSTGESLFPQGSSSSGDAPVPLPDRCDWDDGFTLPPIPQYNSATDLCSSSVLDVRYELFWRGDQIVQVDAIVVLGSVTLSPQSTLASTGEEEKPTFVTPPPTSPPPTPTTEVTMEATVEDLVTSYDNVTDDLATLNNGTDPLLTEMETSSPTHQPTTQEETTMPPTTQAPPTPAPTTQDQTTAMFTTEAVTTPAEVITNSHVTEASAMVTDSEGSIQEVPAADGDPLEFTQRFTVKFTHLPTSLADPTPIGPPQVADQAARSGNPGYITGSRVLSGLAVFNPLVECNDTGVCVPVEPTQPGDFVGIDDAETNRLRVWVPGPGSLCSQSSLADITFGENHNSGCILRLGWTQLSNCTTFRNMMTLEMQSLVAADRIGKIGNASTTLQSNWAPIFNSEEHPVPTDAPLTTETMTTDSMTTSNFSNETQRRPIELLQGLCYDIPTGVNVEVLYAEAGEFGTIIQREIVSAYVTYSKSTVQLRCIGASGFACQLEQTSNETAEWVQSFPVTSTVVFTKVPALEPEPVILYDKGKDFTLCENDQCTEEMYFLLSSRFEGDTPQFTMGVAIFFTLLIIAYCAVTKPWFFTS